MKKKSPIVYTPVRFYENGVPFFGGPSLGFRCLVTSFKAEERGAETGDFYFDLSLTEYKDYSPQRAVVQGAGQTGNLFPPASIISDVANVAARAVSAVTAVNTAVDAAGAVKLSLTPVRSTPQTSLLWGPDGRHPGKFTAPAAEKRF